MKVKYYSVACAILLFCSLTSCTSPQQAHEISFRSGDFNLVGELRLPKGNGPHPLVIFVHGDGPNNRTSGGTYLPIMERMLAAGYGTFAWDKPGTGESTGQIDRNHLQQERSQIVIDAIEALKGRSDIDSERIGLWGISQAGYVMPKVLSQRNDIAFMIAVSCPGEPGFEQGAYFVAQQARCAGLPPASVDQVERLLSEIELVQSYEEYVEYKQQLDDMPIEDIAKVFGYRQGILSREAWHAGNFDGEYYWDPMEVLENTSIPVLAFFGQKDTQVDPIQGVQAYQQALEQAKNPNFRVELIPGTDHTMVLTETGCYDEIRRQSLKERTNYSSEYLDAIESWLRELVD